MFCTASLRDRSPHHANNGGQSFAEVKVFQIGKPS